MKRKLNLQKINYTYLILVVLMKPLQLSFFPIDGKGRIMFFLAVFVFLMNLMHDRYFLNKYVISKPFIFWGLWISYSTINLLVKGYNGELSFPFYFIHILFTPYLVMQISAKETEQNPKAVLRLYTIVLTIYTILSITVLGGYIELGGTEGRYAGELGNSGPLTTMFLIFFVSLLFVHKQIDLKKTIIFIIFAFIVIILAATRKAFAGALIMTVALIISQLKLSAKNIIAIFIVSIVLYYCFHYVMENTLIGQRFDKAIVTGRQYNPTDIKMLNLLGDKSFFYISGWEMFIDHPITGVGLNNFLVYSPIEIVIHSEYIVQLAESGLIGVSLYFLFMFWIGRNLYQHWKYYDYNEIIYVLIGAYATIIFISALSWTYSIPRYFIIFGIIIGYLRNIEYENSNT
jgi:O-antigen ligase